MTGIQPIMLSKATKAVEAIRLTYKEYVCHLKIHHHVPEQEVRKTIMNFIGTIYQVPPKKSAVKRKLRQRVVYDIKILEIVKRNILFKVKCEAGTYIRKLCHDIGLALGVGANMQELVRSAVGIFEYKDGITLQELSDAYDYFKYNNKEEKIRRLVIPMESAF